MMIALLTGKLAYRSIDHLVVDVGGVGYRVAIPLSTFYSLPDQGEIQLHIHTHVKEDALLLFGFLTPEEKAMFVLLISVSGIGPKLALNILSNIPTPDLKAALWEGNLARLASLPGIGKKTAERLVLELREKVKHLGPAPALPPAERRNSTPADALDDTLSALINLGYKEAQARKALESLHVAPEASLEEILKGALKRLVK